MAASTGGDGPWYGRPVDSCHSVRVIRSTVRNRHDCHDLRRCARHRNRRGSLIGRAKRRPVLGAVLGFVLGFIGWIIVACIPAKANAY